MQKNVQILKQLLNNIFHALVIDNLGRDSGDCHVGHREALVYHSVGTNGNVVTNHNLAKNLGSRRNIAMIPYDRNILPPSCISTNIDTDMNLTVFTYFRLTIDYNRTNMGNTQTFPDRIGRYAKATKKS